MQHFEKFGEKIRQILHCLVNYIPFIYVLHLGVYLSKGDVKSIISTLDATLSHCFIFTQILRKYLRHFMHLKQSDIEYIGEDRKKLKNIIIQREFHGLECFYKSLVCAYEEEEDSNIFIVKEKLKELSTYIDPSIQNASH